MALVKGTNCGFVSEAPVADPDEISVDRDSWAWSRKDTAPAGANKITEIGWYCNNATEESNFEVAIYDHNSGDDNPEVIIGVSRTNAKGTDAGWKRVTGLDIAISAETIYWIAIQLDDTVTSTGSNRGPGDEAEKADLKGAQTTLTNPWGESDVSYGQLESIYAVYETGDGPPSSRALLIGRPSGVYATKQCIAKNFVYI